MKKKLSTRVLASLMAMVMTLSLLGGCAPATSGDTGATTPDAGTSTPAPDAGTTTPDAGTTTPDAGTTTPDAGTTEPEVTPEPEADAVWVPFDENGNTKRDERDAVGENGIVTSANVYASMAGKAILEAGGNAVDAAIATSYALGVAEPFASGLGGGGFMIIRTADGEVNYVDYREVAPAAMTPYTWLDDEGELIYKQANSRGGLANGVPGQVAGMEYARENFGSGNLTRQEIMQPAIDLATNGYTVSVTMAGLVADAYESMIGEFPELGIYYLDESGLPYTAGSTFKNPDLAATMQMIADNGKDAIYTGEVAQAIVDANNSYNGLMTLEDLANYEVSARTPVTGTYRGYQIISAPPPSSGGTHVIQMLNVLENYDLGSMDVNSAEYLHLLSETIKLAFADRAAYMGDTDFVEVPLEGLTSKDYAASLAAQITDESQDWVAGDPFEYEGASTTSFTVADKAGNVVTVTQTIECFWGSRVAIDGYGFILNDQMHDFSTNPESVNCIEGGKKPLSSMTPTIVLNEDGTPLMSVGSPGGPRIFPTVMQVIINVIDHDMSMQDAIDCARIYDNGNGDGICLESGGENGVSAETIAALEAMGHTVTDKGEWQLFFGGAQGVLYGDDGMLYGGADPRRDGKALGF